MSAAASGASAEAGVVAAFDFDGTLTRGGSVWPFLVQVCGMWRTIVAGLSIAPMLAVAAFVGGRFADDAKEALFRRTLGGLDAGALEQVGDEFGRRHLAAERRADVMARLDQHRRQGHRIVIVSASPELYVRPAGTELGVDAVLATRLAVDDDGKLTGNYDGGNCRSDEKLRRLRQWAEENAPGAELWAYGNSAGDQRMLAGATVGVDVGRLGPVGRLRAFHRLRDTAELIGA
ncbi:MAG TPA: HAD-IB family hydrolase [Acidimicrobiales bacterium]|nr:HAD-IB family hydrolase [Acidimicrobiales bacterium]